jgi:hypothetical protein
MLTVTAVVHISPSLSLPEKWKTIFIRSGLAIMKKKGKAGFRLG